MKVKDIIRETRNAAFSFEIVPPTRGRSLRHFVEIVESLMPINPRWIDVTAHASNVHFQEDSEGAIRKLTFKKRPGTLGICGVIQNRFQIDTVAHLLCLGFTREETEDALIELNYLGAEKCVLSARRSSQLRKEIFSVRSRLTITPSTWSSKWSTCATAAF